MKRNDVICDICGNVISSSTNYAGCYKGIKIQEYSIFGLMKNSNIDICENCLRKIKIIITNGGI